MSHQIIKICPLGNTPIPKKAHISDAGYDCYAAESAVLSPTGRALIPLGFSLELPPNWAAFILPRSGRAFREGLTVLNSPGLIDSGYRGEVKACLVNHGDDWIAIEPGDRVCQMVIMPVPATALVTVGVLGDSDREGNGFGSTGV